MYVCVCVLCVKYSWHAKRGNLSAVHAVLEAMGRQTEVREKETDIVCICLCVCVLFTFVSALLSLSVIVINGLSFSFPFHLSNHVYKFCYMKTEIHISRVSSN